MTPRTKLLTGLAALLSLAAGPALATEPLPQHKLPPSKEGNLVVGLCDGETSMEVKGVKEGGTMTHSQAVKVTGALMEDWRRKNPNANWDDVPAPAQRVAQAQPPVPQKPAAGSSTATGGPSASSGAPEVAAQKGANIQSGQTYGAFSERDEKLWAASTQAFVEEGNRVFHDAGALGGTISVSCDMCHPNAANTHPETYPKYQVQLGRVAMLRDMINWCIQNPVRGKPLSDEDPKMKALEAYIYAQRKGTPLEYGKH
jgi:thiosulfate dehydrogenase